jgi:glycosyltransferase involved in cell wall biosynthesis
MINKPKIKSGSPLVTVIVPSFNHASFLEERLRSISAQSYQSIEIILLDDASQDHSAQILRRYQIEEPRVILLDINEENSGSTNKQWIKGLKHAKGEFVWIAESDDVAEHKFLEILVKQFSIYDAGLVYCNSSMIDEAGNIIGEYNYKSKYYKNIWDQSFIKEGKELIRDYFIFANIIPNVSAVLFKTKHLQRSLHNSELKYCGDWACYLNLALCSDIVFIHQKLNLFRQHTNTTRWHSVKSYSRELKEKISLLRFIKMTQLPNINENISHALTNLFIFRNKYKRIARIVKSLRQLEVGEIALYGCNDIANILLTELSNRHEITLIFDRDKAGQVCQGIAVSQLNQENLTMINVIVICSLEHAQSMKSELSLLNYKGLILTI